MLVPWRVYICLLDLLTCSGNNIFFGPCPHPVRVAKRGEKEVVTKPNGDYLRTLTGPGAANICSPNGATNPPGNSL